MNILISGGNGLVGSVLVKKLEAKGYSVRILVRQSKGKTNELIWNPKENFIDANAFNNVDSLVHLAGASIFQRWTKTNRQQIISSRIDTAQLLHQKIKENGIHLKSFISASGINYYGTFTSNKIFTEADSCEHQDFFSDVCKQWENAADEFKNVADRVVKLRISPVLSKKGGSLGQLNRLTNLNLASGIGNGKQWFPWIHIDDLVDMIIYSIENQNIKGAYNVVADEIPTQRQLMKTLAKKHKKLFLPFNVPGFVIRLILGEMSEMILEGSRASNGKIKSEGFRFQFPTLNSALDDLLVE